MSRYYVFMSKSVRIQLLLERLARVAAAEDWSADVNPAQFAALSYLDRANRFSRSPSQVADYLSATRGTVSQTLKALARKGLVEERRSAADKRSISYDVTPEGSAVLSSRSALSDAVDQLGFKQATALEEGLAKLVETAIKARGDRAFGLCRTCRHHRVGDNTDRFCSLLNLPLEEREAEQICAEHAY